MKIYETLNEACQDRLQSFGIKPSMYEKIFAPDGDALYKISGPEFKDVFEIADALYKTAVRDPRLRDVIHFDPFRLSLPMQTKSL